MGLVSTHAYSVLEVSNRPRNMPGGPWRWCDAERVLQCLTNPCSVLSCCTFFVVAAWNRGTTPERAHSQQLCSFVFFVVSGCVCLCVSWYTCRRFASFHVFLSLPLDIPLSHPLPLSFLGSIGVLQERLKPTCAQANPFVGLTFLRGPTRRALLYKLIPNTSAVNSTDCVVDTQPCKLRDVFVYAAASLQPPIPAESRKALAHPPSGWSIEKRRRLSFPG